MKRRLLLLVATLAAPWLQAQPAIYTCTDASGRRLTSDRPILECIDREQRVLGPSGTVTRIVGPSMTASERAASDEKARREAQERERQAEARTRQRALLARYPTPGSLERERQAALATVDEVLAAAHARAAVLEAERPRLEREAGRPGPQQPSAQHALAGNAQQRQAQLRFIGDKQAERDRINARFDAMAADLLMLWPPAPPAASASAGR